MDSTEHSPAAQAANQVPRRSPWPKIIGFVGGGLFLLLLVAILIPRFVESELAKDESGSVGSLRTITTAQEAFSQGHSNNGFAETLSELGPSGANEIDSTLASGLKSGYVFTLTPSPRDSAGRITKYTVTASPQQFGETGTRSFFMDESGVVRYTVENRHASASDPPLQ